MADIDNGADFVLDDPLPYTVTNDIKNHSYGAALPTMMQNGMISVLNTDGVPRIKSLGVVGIPLGKIPITNHTANYVITVADLNAMHTMANAAARTFTLPSVDATHIGDFVTIVKLGIGKVTIGRADADTINGQASIYNGVADELYSFMRLRLITATLWAMEWATNPFSWVLA